MLVLAAVQQAHWQCSKSIFTNCGQIKTLQAHPLSRKSGKDQEIQKEVVLLRLDNA